MAATELYHLSIDPNLGGRWRPRQPLGMSDNTKDTCEDLPPRICVSPTIEQCFWAIYPNVSQFFEKKKYPYILMYVYRLESNASIKFIEPSEVITKVHDAYMTSEVCITTPVVLYKVARIKVFNCVKNPVVMYRKFNDPNRPLEFLSHRVKWTIESNYVRNNLRNQLSA